jgi:DNA-binding transcriptional regulator PaaX
MLFDDTPRGLLEALFVAGGVAAALTLAPTLFFALAGIGFALRAGDRRQRKKLQGSFQYLVRHGFVTKRTIRRGMRIELTPRGRAHVQRFMARRMLLQPIARPAIWDHKWRIILFDIPAGERSKRNAFRSLIRRLGAVMLQKSVWIYPFDCSEQVGVLRSVFRLSDAELRLVTADSIGDDIALRARFDIQQY